jgi:hypothetical protein
VLAGLMMLAGVAGVVVPVLPGLPLVWGGVAVWSVGIASPTGWVALALVSVLGVIGSVVKYLAPGRRLRASGVPWSSLAMGTVLGLVGFFVLPVIGAPIGFVLGIYLTEWRRLNSAVQARSSTRAALAAVGWSILIELVTALLMITTWIVAMVTSPG